MKGKYNEFMKDHVCVSEFVQTKSFIWFIIKSLSTGNPFMFLFLKGF